MQQQISVDDRTRESVNLARLLYAGHGFTFFFSLGLLSIVPLIINYAKRPDSEGTIAFSHHGWMIRSFWWYLAWMVIGGICIVVGLTVNFLFLGLGLILFGLAWLWKAYRLIRGFLDLNSNRPAP
jgi:uncharacterized membrane protein